MKKIILVCSMLAAMASFSKNYEVKVMGTVGMSDITAKTKSLAGTGYVTVSRKIDETNLNASIGGTVIAGAVVSKSAFITAGPSAELRFKLDNKKVEPYLGATLGPSVYFEKNNNRIGLGGQVYTGVKYGIFNAEVGYSINTKGFQLGLGATI